MSHSPSDTPSPGGNPIDLREEADMEQLLSDAGARPSLEDRHVAQITEAARAEFRRSFGSQESRDSTLDLAEAAEQRQHGTESSGSRPFGRITLAIAAGLAAIALVSLLSRTFLADVPQATVATVVALEGETASPADPLTFLKVGQRLHDGARLTTSTSSSVALLLATGHSVRLAEGTEVRLVGANQIELGQGAVYIDSGSGHSLESDSLEPAAATGSVAVLTDWGTAIDIGTQFEVRIMDRGRMRVRVREGLVELTHRDGQQRTAGAGTALELDESGAFEEAAISALDDSWSWILAVATAPFETDPSAQQLLDWVSRETGWPVRFESPEARALGAESIHGVHSDIRPVGQNGALQLLPSGKLEARIEDGELVVRKLP